MAFDSDMNRYFSGKISKDQYYVDMYEHHSHLFDYASAINDTIIRKIEIYGGEVLFHLETYGGRNMVLTCDVGDKHALPMTLLNFREYETRETEFLMSLVDDGSIVLDIGANIGWYTLNFTLNRRGVQVYSFEPIRQNYERLVKNLLLNNVPAGNAYCCGFSDHVGTATFYYDTECGMASSQVNLRGRDFTVSQECQISTLDEFMSGNKGIDRIDLVKCDVEGAELFVFKGGIESLALHRPIVFAEMLRKWSAKFAYHPNDIIKLFSQIGYGCYVLNGNSISRIFEVTEDTVETNFIFFNHDRHADLINNYK